jgi:small subunit ribosomal protein S4
VDIPSFVVEPGMEVSFKEKAHKLVRENMESMAGLEVPPWLDFSPGQLVAKVQALPTPENVPFEVNMNLIIEFYR